MDVKQAVDVFSHTIGAATANGLHLVLQLPQPRQHPHITRRLCYQHIHPLHNCIVLQHQKTSVSLMSSEVCRQKIVEATADGHSDLHPCTCASSFCRTVSSCSSRSGSCLSFGSSTVVPRTPVVAAAATLPAMSSGSAGSISPATQSPVRFQP